MKKGQSFHPLIQKIASREANKSFSYLFSRQTGDLSWLPDQLFATLGKQTKARASPGSAMPNEEKPSSVVEA